MDEGCLIFLHLPKTGGSTLTTVLRWQYRKLRPSQALQFVARERSLEEFARLPDEQRAQLSLLMGHFAYGVHESLPKECRYITIVREPVKRFVSTYKYVVSYPAHPLHDQLAASSMTFHEYIESGVHHYQTENAMTRQLAGRDEVGELTIDDVEAAKKNLASFQAVGLTEAFDQSLILFKRILGWSTPFYFSRNVAAKQSPAGEVTDETVHLIRERNGFDLELYGFAASLFQRMIEQYEDGWDRELRAFKLLNRVPRALGGIAEPAAPRVRRLLEGRARRRAERT